MSYTDETMLCIDYNIYILHAQIWYPKGNISCTQLYASFHIGVCQYLLKLRGSDYSTELSWNLKFKKWNSTITLQIWLCIFVL